MEKEIRLNANKYNSQEARTIQTEYTGIMGRLSLDAICNRAMTLGLPLLRGQLNLPTKPKGK